RSEPLLITKILPHLCTIPFQKRLHRHCNHAEKNDHFQKCGDNIEAPVWFQFAIQVISDYQHQSDRRHDNDQFMRTNPGKGAVEHYEPSIFSANSFPCNTASSILEYIHDP